MNREKVSGLHPAAGRSENGALNIHFEFSETHTGICAKDHKTAP